MCKLVCLLDMLWADVFCGHVLCVDGHYCVMVFYVQVVVLPDMVYVWVGVFC